MEFVDCPQCGMQRIPRGCRLCTACEVDERWQREVEAIRTQSATEERERLRVQLLKVVEDTRLASGALDPDNSGWQAACDCIADLIRMRICARSTTEGGR